MRKIWHNGKFVKWNSARIHVLNHALHYGSGVFEGVRAYSTARGPAIFRLRDHVNRLFNSAAAFDIKIPYTRSSIANAIMKLVSLNRLKECYIRPIVFYGEGGMRLYPQGASVEVVIAAWPWGKYLGDHPALSVGISKYTRFDPRSISLGAKISGFYATSVLASIEARKRGFDECLLLDHKGYVAEGPGENLFLIKNGKLIVPESPAILNGFTRDSILKIAKDLKIRAVRRRVLKRELFSADEGFFTGTAAEVAAIGKINGRKIGSGRMGSITAEIKKRYLAAVHGELPQYQKWLSVASRNNVL